MSRRMRIRAGIAIALFGLLLLISNLLEINLWAYLLPLILIAFGTWLILRPQATRRSLPTRVSLLGDVRRRGSWSVRNEDVWLGIGDLDLDFTHARVPEGETRIQLQGLVGEVDLTIPEDLGINIRSLAVITDAHVLGAHQDYVLTPYEFTSSGYETAARRVSLEILQVVTDLRVRQVKLEA
jgi:lia operon protein LiaF